MPEIRYRPATPEELTIVVPGRPAVTVQRMEWTDLPMDLVGKRPSGADLGSGLLAQGDWVDGKFEPYWETRAAAKAQATKRAHAHDEGEEA